jgi:hypothetical protein
MLDDLAENDPQAYGKFLSKQMEGAKELAPKAETRPAFCMQVTQSTSPHLITHAHLLPIPVVSTNKDGYPFLH